MDSSPLLTLVSLRNPARPDLPPVTVQAWITREAFGLVIGDWVAEQLQLPLLPTQDAQQWHGMPQALPTAGPIDITYDNITLQCSALMCGKTVIIGKELTELPGMHPVLARMLYQENDRAHILQHEQFISPQLCKLFRDYAHSRPHSQNGLGKNHYDTTMRYSYVIDSLDGIEPHMPELLCQMSEAILAFYDAHIEYWEKPHILLYTEGGTYTTHADADNYVQGAWQRKHDRDISILLYLNDDFTGGGLYFPEQDIRIQPKAGLLVAFPSSYRYRHTAEPVLSGERLVLVSWVGVKSGKRVSTTLRNALSMDRIRAQVTG